MTLKVDIVFSGKKIVAKISLPCLCLPELWAAMTEDEQARLSRQASWFLLHWLLQLISISLPLQRHSSKSINFINLGLPRILITQQYCSWIKYYIPVMWSQVRFSGPWKNDFRMFAASEGHLQLLRFLSYCHSRIRPSAFQPCWSGCEDLPSWWNNSRNEPKKTYLSWLKWSICLKNTWIVRNLQVDLPRHQWW